MKDKFTFFPDRTTILPGSQIPAYARETWITTSDGETLQAFLFSDSAQNRSMVIYFHGNAGNLYYRFDNAIKLHQMGHQVLLVSYRGYGKSTGTPSEQGIFRDGTAAVDYCINEMGYAEEEITVFGRSLGSTVAVHISQQRDFRGVVLITPLTSGKDMAVAMGFSLLKFIAGNSYNSLEKINNLRSPVLIIHGDRDEVVPYRMGVALFEAYQGPKHMVTVQNGRHNDLQEVDTGLYWGEIEKFIIWDN